MRENESKKCLRDANFLAFFFRIILLKEINSFFGKFDAMFFRKIIFI